MLDLSTKLAPNFHLYEMVVSQTATRHGIDNTPDTQAFVNLVYTAQALQHIRGICDNKAVVVSSGFRCPELNEKVGGKFNSYHTLGLAADFIIPGFGTPRAVIEAVMESDILLPFRVIIEEFGRWVHISIELFMGKGSRKALIAVEHNGEIGYGEFT